MGLPTAGVLVIELQCAHGALTCKTTIAPQIYANVLDKSKYWDNTYPCLESWRTPEVLRSK